MSRNDNPAEEHIQYKDSDLFRIRHSAAHVMAQAVLELYPQASLAIGPPVENGFYYDFDLGKDEQDRPLTFTPEDLDRIETRMRGTIKGSHPFHCRELSPDEARSLFADQSYKLELIDGLVSGNLDEDGNAGRRGAESNYLPARHLRGSLPGPACETYRSDSGRWIQTDERRWRLLAW